MVPLVYGQDPGLEAETEIQPVNQSISQSVNQSISQSVNQSISQSVNQSISQSVNKNLVIRQAYWH